MDSIFSCQKSTSILARSTRHIQGLIFTFLAISASVNSTHALHIFPKNTDFENTLRCDIKLNTEAHRKAKGCLIWIVGFMLGGVQILRKQPHMLYTSENNFTERVKVWSLYPLILTGIVHTNLNYTPE